MAKTVAALFDDAAEAQSAVRDLVNAGYRAEEIGLTANNAAPVPSEGEAPAAAHYTGGTGAATGVGIGAILGGVGGLLIGVGALTIPGIGPVLAAGPLAAGLIGIGVGAVAGGLIGALADLGIPEEEAHYYAEGVRRGGNLVTVTTNDQAAANAANILERHGAVDVHQRAAMWRERGWNGYNPAAAPFTAQQIAQERQFWPASRSTTPPTAAQANPAVANASSPITNATMGLGTPSGASYRGARIYDPDAQTANREARTDDHGTPTALAAQSTPDFTVAQAGSILAGMRTAESLRGATEAPPTTEAAPTSAQTAPAAAAPAGGTTPEISRPINTGYGHPAPVSPSGAIWSQNDRDFRQDFDTRYASAGHRYEEFEPAYRYGTEIASTGSSGAVDWDLVEPELRRDWESRNSDSWERVRDAIRFGWERSHSGTPLDRAA